jgi:hypothetical protein
MLWTFGKVREKQLRRRAVALRQPYIAAALQQDITLQI